MPYKIEVRSVSVRAAPPPPPPPPLVKNTGQTRQGSGQLVKAFPRIGQGFNTGANSLGYRLDSIGIAMGPITDTATAGDDLRVTLHPNRFEYPGYEICTLSAPASFSENAVNTFDAAACPVLAPNTSYFVVVERLTFAGVDDITVAHTASLLEDAGGAAGWSLIELIHIFGRSTYGIGWETTQAGVWQIEVNGRARLLGEPPERPVQTTRQVKNTGQTGLVSSDLTSAQSKHAQAFSTGTNAGGYDLSSIGIRFSVVTDPRDLDAQLTVTLHAGGGADPGALLCSMEEPSDIFGAAVATFQTSGACPTLAPSTTYFVVVERITFDSESVSTSAYSSDGEDSGGAADWSIADGSRLFGTTWTANSASLAIDVRAVDLPPPLVLPGAVRAAGQKHRAALPSARRRNRCDRPQAWSQAFTTGANEHGYELSSIGVYLLCSSKTPRQPATNWSSR